MKFSLLALVVLLLHHYCSAEYNQAVALQHVYLDYAAYCGDDVDQSWSCYWCQMPEASGVTWVANFGNSSSPGFGYVAYSNDTVQVVFRGTDNIAGWILDADFTKVPYFSVPGAEVHEGFYDAYYGMSNQVQQLVTKAFSICTYCTKIIVSGHSLGAGIATLGALDLKQYMPSMHLVMYNFGSPRVGNSVFSSYVENTLNETWRLTNYRDPVPHLPFLTMDYHHISREIWWNGNSFQWCDGSGEDPNCADSIHITNPYDHGDYFQVNIFTGIPHNCLYTDPMLQF